MRLDRDCYRVLGCKPGKNYVSEARAVEAEEQAKAKPPIPESKRGVLLDILNAMQRDEITPKQARELINKL